MNEHIQKILVKIALGLKQLHWAADENVDITLKGEGHVTLTKSIRVEGSMNDRDHRERIDTSIDLKLNSEDQITFFPEYTIYAQLYVEGATIKDIAYKSDASVAFTENDETTNDPEIKKKVHAKVTNAAKLINEIVETHIQEEYQDYLDNASEDVQTYFDTKQWQEPMDND